MLETIIQYIILPIIAAGVGYLVVAAKDQKKKDGSTASGIMLLLRRELFDLHKKFVINGDTMERDDYENIVEVYECYKALGGNSMADKLYRELDELKISEE